MTDTFEVIEEKPARSQLRMAANTGDKHLMAKMIRPNLIIVRESPGLGPGDDSTTQASDIALHTGATPYQSTSHARPCAVFFRS
jgi:hypothetical protein